MSGMHVLGLLAESGGGGRVQEIARTFGVNWPTLFAQIISFCILCAILYRFAYKPVLGMLDKRQKLIADGLAAAAKSREELAEAQAQRKEILVQAHSRATELIHEAHAAAQRVRERETQRAIAEAEQLLGQAREAADREHVRMLTELRHEIGQLVIQTTEKIARKVLTPEDQLRLAEEAVTQVDFREGSSK